MKNKIDEQNAIIALGHFVGFEIVDSDASLFLVKKNVKSIQLTGGKELDPKELAIVSKIFMEKTSFINKKEGESVSSEDMIEHLTNVIANEEDSFWNKAKAFNSKQNSKEIRKKYMDLLESIVGSSEKAVRENGGDASFYEPIFEKIDEIVKACADKSKNLEIINEQ